MQNFVGNTEIIEFDPLHVKKNCIISSKANKNVLQQSVCNKVSNIFYLKKKFAKAIFGGVLNCQNNK